MRQISKLSRMKYMHKRRVVGTEAGVESSRRRASMYDLPSTAPDGPHPSLRHSHRLAPPAVTWPGRPWLVCNSRVPAVEHLWQLVDTICPQKGGWISMQLHCGVSKESSTSAAGTVVRACQNAQASTDLAQVLQNVGVTSKAGMHWCHLSTQHEVMIQATMECTIPRLKLSRSTPLHPYCIPGLHLRG